MSRGKPASIHGDAGMLCQCRHSTEWAQLQRDINVIGLDNVH